jgi:hypothetical protein
MLFCCLHEILCSFNNAADQEALHAGDESLVAVAMAAREENPSASNKWNIFSNP